MIKWTTIDSWKEDWKYNNIKLTKKRRTKIMKIQVYAAIATRGEEEMLIHADLNRGLTNLKRDAFLMKNIDWSAEVYQVSVDIKVKHEEREVLADEQVSDTTNIPQRAVDKIAKDYVNESNDLLEKGDIIR
jgi:hypothetical protein